MAPGAGDSADPVQSSIFGTIVDAESEASISGATIETSENRQAISMDDGYYIIFDHPGGIFSITAKSCGYESYSHDSINVAQGSLTEVNFSLTPSNEAINANPELFLPIDDASDVSLTPKLELKTISWPDSDTEHTGTKWQIGIDSDFSMIIMDAYTSEHLDEIDIPILILEKETTYFWRVKVFDNIGCDSQWSEAFQFKTIADSGDQNSNGIQDTLEVSEAVDMDNNQIPDIDQSDIKSINTGNILIGIKISENIQSIDSISYLPPEEVIDNQGKPDELQSGLFSFKVSMLSNEQYGNVIIYLSQPIPAGASLYKYDYLTGWNEFSANVTISEDRMSLVLAIVDGGIGDSDGVENGIIIDPIGIGINDSDGDGTNDGEDGCPNDSNKIEPGKCGCNESEDSCKGSPDPFPCFINSIEHL